MKKAVAGLGPSPSPSPSRDKVQTALEGIKKLDIGGLEVS